MCVCALEMLTHTHKHIQTYTPLNRWCKYSSWRWSRDREKHTHTRWVFNVRDTGIWKTKKSDENNLSRWKMCMSDKSFDSIAIQLRPSLSLSSFISFSDIQNAFEWKKIYMRKNYFKQWTETRIEFTTYHDSFEKCIWCARCHEAYDLRHW